MSETAKLALEDGTVFTGRRCGANGERQGEVVFNTAMTGYQEVLTDPSYRGQIVTMTASHVGNYGVNPEDEESSGPWVEGFVCRQYSRVASNQRSTESLEDYFKRRSILAIDEVDTRAITRRLRVNGSLNGVLSSVDLDDASLVAKAKGVPPMRGRNLVDEVTCSKPWSWREVVRPENPGAKPDLKHRVALIDCGVKYNIVRCLVNRGCDVTVFPADTPPEAVLELKPDGIMLSNGPGDPDTVTKTIATVADLSKREVPLFGICLGHQILSLAMGAKTTKLPFGHHGANHPVMERGSGRVEITSQNHGFAVTEESLKRQGLEVSHINLNDQTVEGMRHPTLPVFSVQYHPEAAPGPHDSAPLFDRFVKLIAERKSDS